LSQDISGTRSSALFADKLQVLSPRELSDLVDEDPTDLAAPFRCVTTVEQLKAMAKYYFILAAEKRLLCFTSHQFPLNDMFVNNLAGACERLSEMRTRMVMTGRIYPPAMLIPPLDLLAYMSADLRQTRTLLPHDEGGNPGVLVCNTPHARRLLLRPLCIPVHQSTSLSSTTVYAK
jgi:hypothetical protein